MFLLKYLHPTKRGVGHIHRGTHTELRGGRGKGGNGSFVSTLRLPCSGPRHRLQQPAVSPACCCPQGAVPAPGNSWSMVVLWSHPSATTLNIGDWYKRWHRVVKLDLCHPGNPLTLREYSGGPEPYAFFLLAKLVPRGVSVVLNHTLWV